MNSVGCYNTCTIMFKSTFRNPHQSSWYRKNEKSSLFIHMVAINGWKLRTCSKYQVNRNMHSKALMHPWENAKSPWVRIHEGFAETYIGKMFIVLVDSYSKWFYVIPMSNANTTLLVEFLTFFCYSWFTFCYSNQ